MSTKTTWILIGTAIGLLGAAILIKRPEKQASSAMLPRIKAAEITMVQVRPGRGLEIRAVRTNSSWQLVEPLRWPAAASGIDSFLDALEKLSPAAYITPEEIRQRPSAERQYGFGDPTASIILSTTNSRTHLLAGARTAPGDQFFLQVVGTEGAYVLGADFLKMLPSSANDWRDRALVDLNALAFDRVDVTNAGKVFSLARKKPDPWRLVSPISARADQARIHEALEKVHSLRSEEFVSDDPREDLERFGLQPPVLDLALSLQGNPAVQLQFGKSVSNLVFARRVDWHTVVSVPGEFVSDWQRPVAEFRDPYLFPIEGQVAGFRVEGEESFEVMLQTNGAWQIQPANLSADLDLVKEFAQAINGLRIEQFVRDVVTAPELPPYGLDKPARKYVVLLSQSATNRAVELHFGVEREGRVFARRTDEDSIYAIAAAAFQGLPAHAWQLQDRSLWSFRPEDVQSVACKSGGQVRELVRKDKSWSLARGSQGVINDLAVDETVKALANAAVVRWSGRGAEDAAKYGVNDQSFVLTITFSDGRRLEARFGNTAPSENVYVAVTQDQTVRVGELSWILCRDILAHLAPPQKS